VRGVTVFNDGAIVSEPIGRLVTPMPQSAVPTSTAKVTAQREGKDDG
jgi:hypothetical protein